jgi:hypothetical protein
MKSQIFVAIGVALVASVLVTGLASTIKAQSNMTGGNMTGGNMSMHQQLALQVAMVETEAAMIMTDKTETMMEAIIREKLFNP